jgi:hypothetical protein
LEAHRYIAFGFNAKTGRFYGPVHDSTEYWANYFASYQDFSSLHLIESTGRHSCSQ